VKDEGVEIAGVVRVSGGDRLEAKTYVNAREPQRVTLHLVQLNEAEANGVWAMRRPRAHDPDTLLRQLGWPDLCRRERVSSSDWSESI
jgi:hypothetical protein